MAPADCKSPSFVQILTALFALLLSSCSVHAITLPKEEEKASGPLEFKLQFDLAKTSRNYIWSTHLTFEKEIAGPLAKPALTEGQMYSIASDAWEEMLANRQAYKFPEGGATRLFNSPGMISVAQ
jgi:hypothetical protein